MGMSLDGFVAGSADEMDFLVMDPTYDSAPFFAAIDTVLMGRRTFDVQVRHGMRGYPGLRNYVFSRTLRAADFPEVTVVADDAAATVAALREEEGKDIWLAGGGILFRSLVERGLVDTVEVGVSPVLAGSGVPLVAHTPPLPAAVRLELTRCEPFPSGLVVLEYAVRR
jgi:dihydrofolate reductase